MKSAFQVYCLSLVFCNAALGLAGSNDVGFEIPSYPGIFNPVPEEIPEFVNSFPEEIPRPEKGEQLHPGWGYGGFGPGPGGRPGRKICRDRKASSFCDWVVSNQMCDKGRNRKKCRKSCGFCGNKGCYDTAFNCEMASPYTCRLYWFVSGCQKSCNLCPTEETTSPAETTKPEEECVDTGFGCQFANRYKCLLFWFYSGCKRSCGLCSPQTTLPPASTTMLTTTTAPTTTPEETTTVNTTTTQPPTTTTAPATTPNKEITPEETTGSGVEPTLCVDSDPKNCHTWESLGLCYNPKFMEDMKTYCPLSCGICQQ